MKRILFGLILGLTIGACGAGLKVKIYEIIPAQGLVRKQANEVIPFTNAKGYLCMSPSDAEAAFDELKACQGASSK